jgi:hypothetical protein
MTKRRSGKGGYDREYIEALIEEATVDCYDEYEQATGLLTMIQDELDMPFTTRIFGLEVAVVAVEQDDSGLGVVAVCERQGERQRLSLSDLPLPSPPPEGAQWIAAYRLWAHHSGSTDKGDQT